MNAGTFALTNFQSRNQKCDGTFVSRTKNLMELSLPAARVMGPLHSQEWKDREIVALNQQHWPNQQQGVLILLHKTKQWD